MSQIQHHELWRRDFSAVVPTERRLARNALQLLKNDKLLRNRLRDKDDPGIANDLLRLCLPLFEPGALAQSLAAYDAEENAQALPRETTATGMRGCDHSPLTIEPDNPCSDWEEWNPSQIPGWLDGYSRKLFTTLPDWLLPRLAEADGEAPVTATAALLEQALGLDVAEVRLIEYLEQREFSEPLRALLRNRHSERFFERRAISPRENMARLAALLDLDKSLVRAALDKRRPLRAFGLAEGSKQPSDLEDFLAVGDLLVEILAAEPRSTESLLELLIESAPVAAWRLEDFPHLAGWSERLRIILRQAADTAAVGINALFYGAPGTGKTELARALAEACGLRAYQVRSANDDGDGLRREGRLSAYLLAQRLLAKRRDALLIFDEIEDVFVSGGDLSALLSGHGAPGKQKGWMNRMLEENPVPAVWITNDTSGMDPAFLRRFLLPVAFVTPPRSVRRQMAERHLGDCGLPPELLDELAEDAALAPAQLGVARRLIDLHPQASAEEMVRSGIGAVRTLLHGAPMPVRRIHATAFDVAYLNLGGGVGPIAIVQALDRQGRGSLCFYGPPGTGKTAFAEILAEALDRELVVRQASDLISPYVGETERNLARLFRGMDPARSVLLLDEVDSFLADRRQARHSWERTQVNELLQQMERYPGIFVAATNLMSGIDAAALRRFDFKLHFRALTVAQCERLFAREALGDERAPVPPELGRHLPGLRGLTPGDFANVCRQRTLLGEELTPEDFLRRLAAECRLKERKELSAA